jgi:hypothetical protein
MLDDGRERHVQRLGKLAYRCRPFGQPIHHQPPTGIGESVEHQIDLAGLVEHGLSQESEAVA